jgi:tetratricopeptide (TPR) repeat protein
MSDHDHDHEHDHEHEHEHDEACGCGHEHDDDDDGEELTPEELFDTIEVAAAEGAFAEAGMMVALAKSAFDSGQLDDAVLRARFESAQAELERCQGNLDVAADHASRAVSALEGLGAAGTRTLAGAIYTSALIQLDREDVDGAMLALERAARMLEAQAPVDVDVLASVLITMGEVSLEVGEAEGSQRLFGRVLELLRDVEPTSEGHARGLNALTGKAFLGLGAGAAQLRKNAEAKDFLERAVEFLDEGLGAGHPVLIEALERVVETYRAMGDDAAAELAEEELEAARQAFDEANDDDEDDLDDEDDDDEDLDDEDDDEGDAEGDAEGETTKE